MLYDASDHRDPVLGESAFPRRRGLFCKHVELVNNELLLCGAREGGVDG